MDYNDFVEHLDKVMQFEPEVIFWEPINARGVNGKRMAAAGLDFVKDVMTRDAWADNFLQQWHDIHNAPETVGCLDRLHIWVDSELKRALLKSSMNRNENRGIQQLFHTQIQQRQKAMLTLRTWSIVLSPNS